MTVWDKIYKAYENGGQAWATLSEGIDTRFIDIIENNEFDLQSALDIGCGTGKYLKYLQAKGFEAAGIDSSETAVKMTKKVLDDSADIILGDMYEFDILKNKYDLVLSVSTLHHGTKEQIGGLVNKIYENLLTGGKIFVTLPDLECNSKWETFKNDKELTPGTYAPTSGPEKGLPHSFFTKKEIDELFSKFKDLRTDIDDIGRWFIIGEK